MCSELVRQVNYFSWAVAVCFAPLVCKGGPWGLWEIGIQLIFYIASTGHLNEPQRFLFLCQCSKMRLLPATKH